MTAASRKQKREKRSWIVEVRCTVIKSLVIEAYTEAEARQEPWNAVNEEREIDLQDWEVTKVEPNE